MKQNKETSRILKKMEIKKRELRKIIISPECKERIRNNQCPICGKPKSKWKRRKDWRCCCKECTNKFEKDKIIRDWQELRIKVFERDNYKCVKCGFQSIEEMPFDEKQKLWHKTFERFKEYIKMYSGSYPLKEWKGTTLIYFEGSELIADHIKPIALGGDEWDMDNIQTLCKNCNKIKTKQDAKEVAKFRKEIKLNNQGQIKL